MNEVKVVVTSRIVQDKGYVIPYDHRVSPHLQCYRRPNGTLIPDSYVTYEVPLYEVRIVGGGRYKAIRFGLRNLGDNRIPDSRPCDTGLAQARECTPVFLPYYRPHSFFGEGPAGAWQLMPGRHVLIHEGGNSKKDIVGGTLGCIEIVDGGWRQFQHEIESRADSSCSAVGAGKKLAVSIEYAPHPMAQLY
jgi:hypothetical protein